MQRQLKSSRYHRKIAHLIAEAIQKLCQPNLDRFRHDG